MKFKFETKVNLEHKYFDTASLTAKMEHFKSIINNPDHGFFHLTDQQQYIDQTLKLVAKFKNKKHLIQIGIGGSALGPRMLHSALGKSNTLSFGLLDNTDPDYIENVLSQVELKETLFYVVSKSGGTAETIASYIIVRNKLISQGIKTQDFNQYFVFCTDPENGQLRKHVKENHFESLEVPFNVGGRYSVLSPVGLFPAAMLGINIQALYDGANSLKPILLSDKYSENPMLQCAAQLAYLFTEATPSVNETVLMPYSSKLKDFSFWFVQLWAESLGKYSKVDQTSTGITPIPAYGATDQHSQMQLFMEGTNNKSLFLIKVKNTQHDFKLESDLEFESAKKLKGYSVGQLIKAQFEGTVSALIEKKRNLTIIEIERISEESLGQLILYFESLTALMGDYLKVDPFDQPGVELGKKYAFKYLNSGTF